MELMFIPVMHIIIFVSTHICLKLKKLSEQGYISRRCFLELLFFSQPDWYVEPDQNCTLPLHKNGKIGNTSCLTGNVSILGYMNLL